MPLYVEIKTQLNLEFS